MKSKWLLLIFLIPATITFAQESDYSICDCCTYAVFGDKNDFDAVFPPVLIKAHGIKELTIHTTSSQSSGPHDTVFKVLDKEYREMMFRFDDAGHVITQVVFNSRGRYNYIHELTRNGAHQILSKSFYYLDSNGNKTTLLLPNRWIYTYSGNRLSRIKKLGPDFSELPDSVSDINSYTYDGAGRVIVKKSQMYFKYSAASHYSQTITTTYNDVTHTEVSLIRDSGRLAVRIKTAYRSDQKPTDRQTFDGAGKKLLGEEIYHYNIVGQLTRYKAESFGMGSECPDGSTFEDLYSYSSLYLIEGIRHRYGNTLCQLSFVYR